MVINNHTIPGCFMIQSDGSCNEDNMEHLPEHWGMGANKKGSMTLKLFVKFTEWFVKHIMNPRGYGRGMKACILVIDQHASRWCYAGILWLLANNCWPYCEPPKASRWAQVGDNGANAMIVAGMSYYYSVVGMHEMMSC